MALARTLLLVQIACLASAAAAQTWPPVHDSGRSEFEHLPLLYQGPDYTSNYFLPAGAALELGPPIVSPLPPPSQPLPDYTTLPGETIDTLLPDPVDAFGREADCCGDITDHKDGFFQKLSFAGTWLDRAHVDDFGISELDLSATFALPFPTREWPLLITPAFNVRYLDGPISPDLPARLYETYLDFMWVPRLTSRWTGIIAVAPSLYSDFEVDDQDAWRLTGKGLARFDWVPDRLQFLFGVLYLNRDDVRLLPAGGLIWTPSADRRYELLFPRPKLAHRVDCGLHFEDWLYLAGEFGGNTWSIDRNGTTDKVTLRDFRSYVGLERKLNGGAGYRLEIGYVFARTAEFASGIPDAEPDDTAMLRGGVTY